MIQKRASNGQKDIEIINLDLLILIKNHGCISQSTIMTTKEVTQYLLEHKIEDMVFLNKQPPYMIKTFLILFRASDGQKDKEVKNYPLQINIKDHGCISQ